MRSLYRGKKYPEQLWMPTHPEVEIFKVGLGGALGNLLQ